MSSILHYYHVNKTFMSQVGIWPYQRKIVRILIPSAIVLIEISGVTTEMIRVVDTWCDINIAVECLISVLIILICLTKLFNISFKIKEIRNLFSLIEYHWSVFTNSTDVKILRDYLVFGRKVIIFYAIYIYITMLLFLMIPVIPQILDIVTPLNESRPRRLLFELDYYRLDMDKYYYPIMFHCYLAVTLATSALVSVDTAYIIYVQHGCALFATIGYQLERIASKIGKVNYLTRKEEGMWQDVKDEDIYLRDKAVLPELVVCLRKHQLAIEYVNLLESLFALSTGIQLLINMIGISVLGIQVLANLNNTDDLIRYLLFTAAAFFHLLVMSLPGQRLMDHSIDVFNKVSQWYKLSLENKRLLQILLYRSIIPCTLTAGKVYVMSMTNFGGVVQSAMSYFMTFSSMK